MRHPPVRPDTGRPGEALVQAAETFAILEDAVAACAAAGLLTGGEPRGVVPQRWVRSRRVAAGLDGEGLLKHDQY